MQWLKSFKYRGEAKDYLTILIGTLSYGFGFNAFILSNEVITGGVSGLCALIYFASGQLIPVSVSYFIINVGLLAAALKILGLKFLLKTIFGVFSLSASLSLFEIILKEPLIHDEPFMSIILGGCCCGLGLGLVFSANGSTGGTDIIASIISKYKDLSIGTALLICDFFIIGSSYFLFHDIEKIVFRFIEMIVSTYMLDQTVNNKRQSVQFMIFSQKYKEISQRIINDLGRGCTILDGEGGYTGNQVKVVVVIAKVRESDSIFKIIKSIDKNAFISQGAVRGVYGEGFDQIKG